MGAEVIVYKPEEELNPVERIVQRVNMVNDLYQQVMRKDVHYGKIGNTEKDTLLLPGAQKICTMFQIVPKIDSEKVNDLGNGHREIEMVVGLYNRESGSFWGQGTGSCSTMESKYRYRYIDAEFPQDYWQAKYKYPDLQVRKGAEGWYAKRKIENPDIADIWNTVRKMCFKRALVSATITAAGIADIFNQDLDDIDPADIVGHKKAKATSGNEPVSSGAPVAGKAPKLNFAEIQKEIEAMTDPEVLEAAHQKYVGMGATDKQMKVIDGFIDKQLGALDNMVPAADMFPEGE